MLPRLNRRGNTRNQQPWSPLTISLLALVFPAGAAVLTIRNLQRLLDLDPKDVRKLTIAVIAVFSIGLATLFLAAHKDSKGIPNLDPNAQTVLSAGVAIVSYAVQRTPFRNWRARHSTTRANSWLAAIGVALLYQVVAVGLAVPLFLAVYLGAGGST